MTRRGFLIAAGGVSLATAARKPAVALFSKPLQHLNWLELGRVVKELGMEGVDLTVRPGGHVLPERVREDLPRAVETLRSYGLSVPMITTGITSGDDPAAGPVLATAARLSIPYYKLGYWRYAGADIEETLRKVRRDAETLVHLGRAHGIQAGWHNHPGDYVGVAVWDIRAIIADLDPLWIGYYYDLAHAAAEGGGGGWMISQRVAMTRLKMLAVKDCIFEKKNGRWVRRTCPLGRGIVNFRKAFEMLAVSQFSGPISLHVEYPTDDPITAIASDLAFLKKELAKAYELRT